MVLCIPFKDFLDIQIIVLTEVIIFLVCVWVNGATDSFSCGWRCTIPDVAMAMAAAAAAQVFSAASGW